VSPRNVSCVMLPLSTATMAPGPVIEKVTGAVVVAPRP